jgi:hypothetical protein
MVIMGNGSDQQQPWTTTPSANKPSSSVSDYQTPTAVKMRTSCETDAWSDPRASAASSSRSQSLTPTGSSTTDEDRRGIAIPSFLQTLFGIDFIPYLPEGSGGEEAAGVLTDQDLEDLDLLGSSIPNGAPVVLPLDPTTDKGLDCIVLEDPAFLATVDDDDDDIEEGILSPSGRTRWKQKRRFAPALRKLVRGGRRRADSASKVASRIRTGSWHGENALPVETTTPNTKTKIHNTNNNHLEWLQEQQTKLASHQSDLATVQQETQAMQRKSLELHKGVGQVQSEISKLQTALAQAEQRLVGELQQFDQTRSELVQLETVALQASQAVMDSIRQIQLGPTEKITPVTPIVTSSDNMIELGGTPKATNGSADAGFPSQRPGEAEPLRQRAATEPSFLLSSSSSFMRVHDLEIVNSRHDEAKSENDVLLIDAASDHESSSTSSSSVTSCNNHVTHDNFIFVDHNVTTILQNLSKLGYGVATDESKRFTPTRDTERLLTKYKTMHSVDNNFFDNWPIPSWHAAHGSDILVWTGGVDHNGFGSDWPVVKARGLVDTSPRKLLEYLMDSSKIKEYNKMSQGREDVMSIQVGIDTTVADSPYGFAGDCKIIKSLNKPRLLPKTIEMLSLTHSQPLETTNAPGSYMTVIRSVFEDDSGEHKSKAANTIRSEMLLGVILIRPADQGHQTSELTTITHVYSPGVPEMLAKRAAPSSATNMMRDIQNMFKRKK